MQKCSIQLNVFFSFFLHKNFQDDFVAAVAVVVAVVAAAAAVVDLVAFGTYFVGRSIHW